MVEIALRSATFFSLSAFDTPCYITFRVYLFIPLLRGTKYLFSALLLNKQLIKGIFFYYARFWGHSDSEKTKFRRKSHWNKKMADQSWKTSLSQGPYKTSFPSTVIYSILSKATCKLGLPILITRYGSPWLLNFCYLAWHLCAKMRKCIYFQVPREVYTVAWPSGLRQSLRRPGF